MLKLGRLVSVLALLAGWRTAIAQPAVAEPPAPATREAAEADDDKWMRLAKNDRGEPLGMQTAIVRYTGKPDASGQPVTVDLIGAVHVGDVDYYNALNKRFEQYDALLYELVAPTGTVIEPGTKASSRHALGAIQNGMKDILQLEHQLEQIDYTKQNFVHADMSPDEFFESMKRRDESLLKLYFRVMGEAMAAQSNMGPGADMGEADMLKALLSKPDQRARALKLAMAKQMTSLGDLFSNLGGAEGTTIINERNRKAFEVLREQIQAGHTKLGVFYGAGHLDDMDERLQKEFHLKPQSTEWLTAWDLQK